MKKAILIPNFLKIYNRLWKTALPFLHRHPRLAATFGERTAPFRHGPRDIWIQAASAGEALLAVSLVRSMATRRPLRILVTTLTVQGMDILESGLSKECLPQGITLALDWFAFDMPEVMEKTVARIRPKVMVLLETELWPAHLNCLKARNARILVVNARMSRGSGSRYRATRFFWRHLAPDTILAVSEADAARYRQVFASSRVSVMPNIKFEGLDQEEDHVPPACLDTRLPLSILASMRRQEEKQGLHILCRLFEKVPNQVVAVFPRHMHRIKSWQRRLAKTGLPVWLRSGLFAPPKEPGIILWDQFGELRMAYRHAAAVFVGGSLVPLGGQNFVEPVIQGAPTVTGPFWDDFAWVGRDIFDSGLVQKAAGWKEAADAMTRHLNAHMNGTADPEKIRCRAQDYIRAHSGGASLAARTVLSCFN